MLGAHARQLHALLVELAQEERAWRVEPAQLRKIDGVQLAAPELIPYLRKRVNVEHALEREAVALFSDGNTGIKPLRICWLHGGILP